MPDSAPNSDPPHSDEVARRRRMAELWMDAQPSVMSFILASVPQIHDAEDLLQQAAVDVATNFERYDPSRPFVAWALGIARNKMRAHFRKGSATGLVFSESALDAIADAHAATHDTAREQHEALSHCMKSLGDKPSRLLKLRYHENLSHDKIAESLGSTSGSVRVQLSRVRTQLADCIRTRLEAMERDA